METTLNTFSALNFIIVTYLFFSSVFYSLQRDNINSTPKGSLPPTAAKRTSLVTNDKFTVYVDNGNKFKVNDGSNVNEVRHRSQPNSSTQECKYFQQKDNIICFIQK